MITELKRHKKAVAVLTEALKQYTHPGSTSVCDVLVCVDGLLNPPPEYEEVEVVRWMCTRCDEVYDFKPVTTNCGATLNAHGGECEGTEYIKLTGTLRRPKPQKVERSVSFPCTISHSGGVRMRFDIAVSGDNSAADAVKRDSLDGKTGHMTFTWTEEGEGK